MIGVILILLLSLLPIYVFLLIRWGFGVWTVWGRSKRKESEGRGVDQLSIVIPVRNEADRIQGLLGDLMHQESYSGTVEIIIVDDHSNDNTQKIAKEFLGQDPPVRIMELGRKEGKKDALSLGIENARYTFVITMDADCRVRNDWLRHLLKSLDPNSHLTILPVLTYSPKGFFQSVLHLEYLALLGGTIGSAGIGDPILANGAGLVLRRNEFLQSGGYERNCGFDSGDDVFLLHEWKAKKKELDVIGSESLLIRTGYPHGLREWMDQRVRWGGKAKGFRDLSTILSMGVFGVVNVLLVISGVSLMISPDLSYLFALSFGIKAGVDLLFLILVAALVKGGRMFWWAFPFGMVQYPVQVFMLPIIRLFRKPKWKGRIVQES